MSRQSVEKGALHNGHGTACPYELAIYRKSVYYAVTSKTLFFYL